MGKKTKGELNVIIENPDTGETIHHEGVRRARLTIADDLKLTYTNESGQTVKEEFPKERGQTVPSGQEKRKKLDRDPAEDEEQ